MMAEPRARNLEEEGEKNSLACTTMAKPGTRREPWVSPSNQQEAARLPLSLLFFVSSYDVCVCVILAVERTIRWPTPEQPSGHVFIWSRGAQRRVQPHARTPIHVVDREIV